MILRCPHSALLNGKREMRQTKSQETQGEEKGKRGRAVFHWTGKQCHLLILVRDYTVQQKSKFKENFYSCQYLGRSFQFPKNHEGSSFIPRPILVKTNVSAGIEIPFVSYSGEEREELHMAEWKWVTSESFLIDQSLSKAKAEGEGKQTLQKCWFGTDTSENRLDYLIIIFAFGWRLWCECDCRGFPFTL